MARTSKPKGMLIQGNSPASCGDVLRVERARVLTRVFFRLWIIAMIAAFTFISFDLWVYERAWDNVTENGVVFDDR